jgi:hypothetical protein
MTDDVQLSPRAQAMFDWIKEQDALSVERLRKQMLDINQHYNELYRKYDENTGRPAGD